MFGKVTNMNGNHIYVSNAQKNLLSNLKGIHVTFEDQERKIIGKVIEVNQEEFDIYLLGEIIHNTFIQGIYKAPSLNVIPRIIKGEELILLVGSQQYHNKNTLLIGNSMTYDNFKITANMNQFFSNHFAIIGNSGYGKSCGVARILQNVFTYNETPPINAHIVLFDVYGEYHEALKSLEKVNGIHVKNYENSLQSDVSSISFPPYFLDADDLAILLNVEDAYLIPILEKTLQYVRVFKNEDPASLEYKNNIIATALLEVLSSGKEASQIRDQIISILTKYHTPDLSVNSEIKEPGYTRTLKQCLNIDSQGKINAISQVIDFLNQFKKMNLQTNVVIPNLSYTLEDIYDALEFALLSEGVYNSVSMYERAVSLKTHLYQIINSPNKRFFDYKDMISKQDYIEGLFHNQKGENVQIININLDEMEDRFAKILTKLYSKLFFNYATTLQNRGSFPVNIILEEAHRYVNNDNDIHIIGYNIFDRITKEGRKYGVLMGFITQRPSELSKTALSQCSNFLVFRIFHPDDYEIIDAITSSVTRDDLESLKTLRRGMALCFGTAFSLPMIAKLEIPTPPPASSNVDITETWY